MEMLRESRARDKVDGVDRNACIVDRNQFFNTQVLCGFRDVGRVLPFTSPFAFEKEGATSFFSIDYGYTLRGRRADWMIS